METKWNKNENNLGKVYGRDLDPCLGYPIVRSMKDPATINPFTSEVPQVFCLFQGLQIVDYLL